MSQRSALYANILSRLETAYMNGWRDALNKYFLSRNMSGFVDKFTLNMNPIVTNMDQVLFDKRDASIQQATAIVELMRNLGVEDEGVYKNAIQEILTQAFPQTGSAVMNWGIDLNSNEAEGGGMM